MIPIGRHNDLDNQMGGDHLQRGSSETREAVVEMTTYHARVSRGDVFWLVHIPEIDHYTQVTTATPVPTSGRTTNLERGAGVGLCSSAARSDQR